MNGNVFRTITIRGTSEGLDKLTADVNKLAAAEQNVAIVSDQSAKRVLSLEEAYRKQTLKLDEAARAQANITRETKLADAALREGLATQQQHAQRLDQINQRYATATTATKGFAQQTGLARHELINLGRQAQDVGVSLASGQSPLTVLFQQGSQIADVFVSSRASVGSFFTQAIGWAGRFAVSAAGVATGLGAIGAGALYAASSWADAQREIDKAVIGIGRRSGVTARDINEIAKSGATATGLSVDEARGAALEFVKTGAIYRENIKAAVAVTHDFSIVTGKNAKEAAQDLGAALASPVAGADKLNAQLGFLDGRTREYIATLVSQNNKQEAQAVLLRNLAPAIQAATATLGPFEKAWNAVANAASAAKNAIGQAITPPTTEGKVNELTNRRDQPKTGVGLFNQPGNLRDIERSNAGLENLNETLRETAKATALAFSGDIKLSSDADEAVRALVPYIDQLKQVEGQINKIKAAQESAGAQDRQGLGGQNQAALNAAEVLAAKLKEASGETERLNERTLQISQSWGDVGVSTAMALEQLKQHLPVAQAITGQQQIQAQYYETINNIINQGKTAVEATAVAEAQRAISLAQVNAEADRMLKSLQQEGELIRADTDAEKDRIKARQTYQNLVDKDVDSTKARMIASKQLQNAEEERSKKEEAAAEKAIANIKTQTDAWNAYKAGIISWSVAYDQAALAANRVTQEITGITQAIKDNNEALLEASKFIPFATTWAGMSQTGLGTGGKSQFSPEGYKSSMITPQGIQALAYGGESGVNMIKSPFGGMFNTFTPNTQGYETFINNLLSGGLGQNTGTSISGVIDKLLSSDDAFRTGFGSKGVNQELAQTLSRLTNLLPDSEKAGVISREIFALNQMPETIARDELIKSLTDELKRLTDATNDNTSATSAMTDVLSPFYSSDPRRTHLGFRAFAGGGIMTEHGMLPLKQYQGGGMATSPQVAVFGEGSTPEAYVPVPSGRIPVIIQQPANSNDKARDIKVFINVQGNASPDTVNALKSTAFQQAQSMRRAMRG